MHKKPRPPSRSFRVDEVGRGCENNDPDYNRELGFFVLDVEKVFSFRPDWHQVDRAKPLVRQYQIALDAVLQSHPELLDCAVFCKHCGIRFLTDPRNRRRRDLHCPFGCQRPCQRQCGNRRSRDYYRTSEGKARKKELNARRRRCTPPREEPQTPPVEQIVPLEEPLPEEPLPNDALPNEASPTIELRLEGVVLNEATLRNSPMLPYVRMVVNLIEGTRFDCDEIVTLLVEAVRQRSMASRKRTEYLLDFLHQHPPQHPP